MRGVDEVRLARIFWVAEHLGGVFYDRFASHVENRDVAGVFDGFAKHEHHHADWYAEWLGARGHALPKGAAYEALILPSVRLFLAPQPLDRKLRTFAATEAAAARHLTSLARKIKEPELKAIVERTIPFEHKHAQWYELEGRHMLRPADRR